MLFFDISNLHIKEMAPGLTCKVFLTKNLSVGFWNMARQTLIPSRQCEFETLRVVLEGQLMLTINQETCRINPGMGILLPSKTEHSIRVIASCSGIDISVFERKVKNKI